MTHHQPSLLTPDSMPAWPWGAVAPMSADLIMADPPWRFELFSAKGEGKSAQAHYRTMTTRDIERMPVWELAAPDCLLWLWCTWPMLPEALGVLRAWQFGYVTGGAWHKTTRRGRTAFGTGYRLRSACEPFLIGIRGEPHTTRSVRNLVEGEAREHSRKPEAAYAAAEALMPGARRLELFSRTDRPGWQAWGDETGKFDNGDTP